ncbi:3-methyl-2-oxobutanoate dehydrogenase subunit alpha [Arthrobacter saudimassiliensis]|uniref:3-methyl-2-oxobutanoate dehydrogenase subunit alpha n=1 Tax=Arthrobacter saudimassiliensis TaxID=1461584 RepID=A0A078MMW7_9MICC|nr:3-methyl-2-oxobutanoate dehydrogenase subunit alpha [Arthrobacter saudimassiliensis]
MAPPPQGPDPGRMRIKVSLHTPVRHPENSGTAPDEPLLQLIRPDGERVADALYDPLVQDIGHAALQDLYEDMAVIRRIDAEATALQRQGQLGLWPPLLGQEASQIGSVRALRPSDFVFPSYRENGVAYCRGVAPEDLLKVWRGNAGCAWDPFEVNLAPTQIIIGAQSLHAAGYGMGIAAEGSDDAVITYFGDGATSQGDVNEAMVFAASFQAPVVFFCQNNHWAISEPVGVQARVPIAHRAPGFGIPSIRVDGNDVLAVLAATRAALERARTGGGPTFIEAVTYRMGPHTTADDPTRYRDANELEDWRARDPLSRIEAHLTAAGAFPEDFRARVEQAADDVAARLRAGCIGMPDPQPLDVFAHVYAEPHTWLKGQQGDYERYLAMFAEPQAGTAAGGGA